MENGEIAKCCAGRVRGPRTRRFLEIAGSRAIAAVVALGIASAACGAVVRDGERLAFVGDSITYGGAMELNGGYCTLVVAGLAANGINVTPIWAGVCGERAPNMFARLNADVFEKHADVVCVNAGVNDAHYVIAGRLKMGEVDPYASNVREILKATRQKHVRTVLLTPTMLGEMPGTPRNMLIDRYSADMRALAREYRVPVGDVNAEMKASLARLFAARPKGCARRMFFEKDGVHMWREGFVVMAIAALKGLGLDEKQMAVAQQHWLQRGIVKPEVLAGVLGDFKAQATRDHWFPMLKMGGREAPKGRLAWIKDVSYVCDDHSLTQFVAKVTVVSTVEAHLGKEPAEINVSIIDKDGLVQKNAFFNIALKPGVNVFEVPLVCALRLDAGPASAPNVYVAQVLLTTPGEWNLGWGEKYDVYPPFPFVFYPSK